MKWNKIDFVLRGHENLLSIFVTWQLGCLATEDQKSC